MFQLSSVNGAGVEVDESASLLPLPFTVGREASASLRIEEPGVWESHLKFNLDASRRIQVTCHPETDFWLNEKVRRGTASLKPGDLIRLGNRSFRLELTGAVQKSSKLSECTAYLLTGIFILSQFFCVYWFLLDA